MEIKKNQLSNNENSPTFSKVNKILVYNVQNSIYNPRKIIMKSIIITNKKNAND